MLLIYAIIMSVAVLALSLLLWRQKLYWTGYSDGVEQGVIELGESYEAEMLDLQDQLAMARSLSDHLAEGIADRDEIIEHHAKYCHEIVEDTFELIKFRLRQAHPNPGDVFHEHDSIESCHENECLIDPTNEADHVYFDCVVPVRHE